MRGHTKVRIIVFSGGLALTALACAAEPADGPTASRAALAETPAAPYGRHPEELTHGRRLSSARIGPLRAEPVLWGRAHLGHTVNKRVDKPAAVDAVTAGAGRARTTSPAPVPLAYREKQQAYLRRLAEL